MALDREQKYYAESIANLLHTQPRSSTRLPISCIEQKGQFVIYGDSNSPARSFDAI